jgi:hypothetical protein
MLINTEEKMQTESSENTRSLKWVAISASVSFSASVFQVAFIRVMSYSFPFQMMFAISLISATALFFWGLGAVSSKWFSRFLKIFLIGSSIVSPGVLTVLSLLGLKNAYGGLTAFLIAIALSSIPFFIYGIIGGICYENQQKQDKKKIPMLIAAGSIAFFGGFAGSSYLLVYTGVWNLVFISSVITFFTALGINTFIIAVPVLSLIIILFNPGETVFAQFAKKPVFWFTKGETHKWVGGGWSPYARVDFYDTGNGTLAGLYNGVQYWITGKPELDVKLRRKLYRNIKGEVAVVATGGGHGLLSLVNASRIEAVELDPEVVRFMKGPLSEYNSNIYNKIDNVYAGDGRAYMERTQRLYDNIILEAAEVALSNHPRSFISFENHLYTTEAMDLYTKKLKKDGVLYVIHTQTHVPTERFLKAMPEEMHYKLFEVPITIPGNEKAKFVTMVTAASRSQEKIRQIEIDLSSAAIDAKDVTEQFLQSEQYLNATPISDNSPALHYKNFSQIIPFIVAAFLFLLISFGMVFKSGRKALGLFFVATGSGFIINQLFIINILKANMGGYMETAALSLGFLTFGAALGAIYSPKIKVKPVFAAVVISFAFSIVLLSNFPIHFNYPVKLILIFIAVFPLAFFTGILFPKGMAEVTDSKISLYLGIDTAASAAGFLFFYVIVTLFGFFQAALIAAVLYVVAAGILIKLR